MMSQYPLMRFVTIRQMPLAPLHVSPDLLALGTAPSGLKSDGKLSPEILVQQTNAFSLPWVLLEKWLTRVKSLPIQ
jgi:hypothetical protein